MATTLFTNGQWKELERQALIYKYMVASIPIPYELLLPIIQNLPPIHSPSLVRYYKNKQDLEPGRCKRTDGKKWRCSREIATPNQKYCDRHMHRGRSRSRKHVEQPKTQLFQSSSRGGFEQEKKIILSKSISPITKRDVGNLDLFGGLGLGLNPLAEVLQPYPTNIVTDDITNTKSDEISVSVSNTTPVQFKWFT